MLQLKISISTVPQVLPARITAGLFLEFVSGCPSVAAGGADGGAVAAVAGGGVQPAAVQGGQEVLLHAAGVQVVGILLGPDETGKEEEEGDGEELHCLCIENVQLTSNC